MRDGNARSSPRYPGVPRSDAEAGPYPCIWAKLNGVDLNGVPYTTLLFAKGHDDPDPPQELTAARIGSRDFHERAGVPTGSETHGGMDVPLYAWGPSELRERLGSTIDNTEVFDVLKAALPVTQTSQR